MLTGRRDGSVSIAAEADLLLPSPFANFSVLKKNFNDKGLTVKDLVVLSGMHFYIYIYIYRTNFTTNLSK